ncbi:MAG: glutathione S-transferase N-terminal domain-containing protein [Arenicella sp.]|nr:glutathione S-transferase N-terminal domain-containing protein [Arenicella sp.]
MTKPILYSFRRCPYAIRTRLALAHNNIDCEVREVELRNKPVSMLQVSSKGTVPVLCLNDGTVIDESVDIMAWAATHGHKMLDRSELAHVLVAENDGPFKSGLDRYKYFDRHPEHSQDYYWSKLHPFLETLDQALVSSQTNSRDVFLMTPESSLLDWAIFPFVRQCYFVAPDRFDALQLPRLNSWLHNQLNAAVFIKLMRKRPFWYAEEDASYPLLEVL